MGKRKFEDAAPCDESRQSNKRARYGAKQNLLELSDELILRVLSFLSTSELVKCERVSQKFQSLATDNEIWREKFFDHFVKPRARRIPGMKSLKTHEGEGNALKFSSKAARWLEHSHLTRKNTEWKRVYKVKSNWARGVARTTEVVINPRLRPSVLVKVHRGIIFTMDDQHGLRSWRRSTLLDTFAVNSGITPTALALHPEESGAKLAVAFEDGSVCLVSANDEGRFKTLGRVISLVPGSVSSLALAWPFLLSFSANSTMMLHQVVDDGPPHLTNFRTEPLANLQSNAGHGPIALSLRKLSTGVLASVVYPFHRYNAGWCLGLQELKLSHEGSVTSSRLTSSTATPKTTLKLSSTRAERERQYPASSSATHELSSRSTASEPFALHPQFACPPNTISFSGCYVLAGLPDNTLMLYTVRSTDQSLEISSGRRLWGHTSAVAAAEVTGTGKALSISAKSDEMRYWELEDLFNTYSPNRPSTSIKSWTDINSAIAQRGDGLGLALKDVKRELNLTRKWVGFDEEQAVILGERDQRQILSCFDFA